MIESKAVYNKVNRDFTFKLGYEEKEKEYSLIYKNNKKEVKKDKITLNLKPNQLNYLKNDKEFKNFLISNISKYYDLDYKHSKNDYAKDVANDLVYKLSKTYEKEKNKEKEDNTSEMLQFIKDKRESERENISNFISQHYYEKIIEIVKNPVKNVYDYGLEIDYNLLMEYNEEMGIKLLKEPLTVIKKFNNIINKMIESYDEKISIFSRFVNINNNVEFNKVNKNFINQLITTKAVIKSVGTKKPYLKEQILVCSSCGQIHTVPLDQEEPKNCIFCHSSHFKPTEDPKAYGDVIEVLLQEPLTECGTRTPSEFLAFIKDDLINSNSNNSIVGQEVLISGIVKIRHLDESKSYYLEIHNMKFLSDESSNLIISEEDLEKIKLLSQREDILRLLCDSLLPHYVGENYLKLGCLCFLLGGGYLEESRQTINILIIGDPGTSKTKIKERLSDLSYKSISTSGETASKVGLTYAVVKDKLTKTWTLEAGAIVLANNGHCFIDEIDKFNKEDLDGFNSALESNRIYVNKAGINTVLIAKTSIMCLGNPKYKRYDNYKTITENINIDSDVFDRFDLKFILRDKPSEKDDEIFDTLLDGLMGKNEKEKELIETSLLRKYLFEASKLEPKLTEDGKAELKNHWGKCRGYKTEEVEEEIEHYNTRNIISIIRLSGAIAKAQFKEEIGINEVKQAIELELDTLKKIGYDPTTNKINIDKVNGGSTSKDKRNRELIKKRLKELQEEKQEPIIKSELIDNCCYNEETSFIRKSTFYHRYNELIKNKEIREIKNGISPIVELY